MFYSKARRSLFTSIGLFCLLFEFGLSGAQSEPKVAPRGRGSETRQLQALFVEDSIQIDGFLEPIWESAPLVSDFLQKDPEYGQPGSERTEVRVLYNRESIYFAIRCYDSEPSGIIARERRRDDPLENDDRVAIILDTFHDHRNAFLFRTNPLGTQFDALITDESRDLNSNWDEKWLSAAQIGTEGWTVEIELPFKILRIQPSRLQTWGVDFERLIRRRNEFDYWNNYSRDFFFEQVSQAGHLQDLADLNKGAAWRIKPFVVGGFRSNSRTDRFEDLTEVGLEDLKYRVTPGLTAQFTLNTDFAQTDVDDQKVNLDRFPLFFPEKREFFLEGLGNFEIGARLEDDPADQTIRLFFSRRIGLSDRGEAVPILGGGRLTGRAGRFTLGVLQMWTDDFESALSGFVPAHRFTVTRVKTDILDRSSVGFFVSSSDSEGRSNRVYAVDSNLVFWSHLNLSGFAGRSQTSDTSGQEWAASGRVFWDSDRFTFGAGHLIQQPQFHTDLGFSPRDDFKKSLLDVQFKPRPVFEWIRQFSFRALLEYFSSNQNVLQSRSGEYSFITDFQSGDRLRIVVSDRHERVFEAFHIGPIPVPAGDYPGSRFNVEYTASPSRRLTGDPILEYLREWGFWSGGRHVVRLKPVLRVSDKLTIRPRYEVNYISIGDQNLRVQVTNSRLDYAFNNQWLTSFIAQHNSLDNVTGFNFRLNYIYRPGDDFFLIYNSLTDRFNRFEEKGLILKFTHSFDF